ncbi:hypothetical protein [uncultured Microscilla sp.]|uniref:hypothetical protein n=1 Tax=uncultured Microscilla sp. TaxID=432653 RepID=UPI00260A8C2A|nr:hypothetical protein [uncultured Microscilla sp.]
MQKLLYTTFFLCLCTLAAMSQNTLQSVKAPNKTDANGLPQGQWLFLYDKNWKLVQDKTQAEFYRVMTFQNEKVMGKVVDYYKSGTRQVVIDSVIDWRE